MSGGDTTTVNLYKGDTNTDGTGALAGKILIDATTYNMYVGIERTTGAAVFDTNFHGYIHDLHVYQRGWVTTNDAHSTAGCTGTNCLTIDFNKYKDGSNSAQDCKSPECDNRSCVKSGICQPTGDCADSYDFCHLCKDRECKKCLNYTECINGQCGLGGHSESDGTSCKCVSGYGRDTSDLNNACAECHGTCDTCTTGGLTDYSDCTKCKTDTGGVGVRFPIDSDDTRFCTTFCPTRYTPTSGVCDPPVGDATATLYKQSFSGFGTSFPDATIGITATPTGTYPAY
jgi:hypothetical protein